MEQGDDSPFGINCFQFPEMERELGAKYLRWEFAHQLIEPEQGRFDWERTDRIVSEAKAQDIRILGLISSTAKWNSTRPDAADYYSYAPRDHKALHAYVTAVVNRYKDYIKYWEIWNEPDLPYAWNGSHADFVRVMKTIYEAIKAADPEAKVAAMALDGGFAPFLDAVLAAGGGALFRYLFGPYLRFGGRAPGAACGSQEPAGQIQLRQTDLGHRNRLQHHDRKT